MGRWREVVILVAITLIFDIHSALCEWKPYSVPLQMLVSLLLFLITMVLQMGLQLGFLRSAYREGAKSQDLSFLWRVGRRFLSRYIQFTILVVIIWLPLFLVSGVLLRRVCPGVVQSREGIAIGWTIVMVITMKPLLCVPAFIVVEDCSIRKAWKLTRRFRLRQARTLIALYLGICIWNGMYMAATKTSSPLFRSLSPLEHIVSSVCHLVIALEAIRVVNLANGNKRG